MAAQGKSPLGWWRAQACWRAPSVEPWRRFRESPCAAAVLPSTAAQQSPRWRLCALRWCVSSLYTLTDSPSMPAPAACAWLKPQNDPRRRPQQQLLRRPRTSSVWSSPLPLQTRRPWIQSPICLTRFYSLEAQTSRLFSASCSVTSISQRCPQRRSRTASVLSLPRSSPTLMRRSVHVVAWLVAHSQSSLPPSLPASSPRTLRRLRAPPSRHRPSSPTASSRARRPVYETSGRAASGTSTAPACRRLEMPTSPRACAPRSTPSTCSPLRSSASPSRSSSSCPNCSNRPIHEPYQHHAESTTMVSSPRARHRSQRLSQTFTHPRPRRCTCACAHRQDANINMMAAALLPCARDGCCWRE